MHRDLKIFLTGATGALGRCLIRELLTKTEQELYLLIRRKGRFSPLERARRLLSASGLDGLLGTRVEVLGGDVTLPALGLGAEERALLRREVGALYHIAALTALNGGEESCRRVNGGGTSEALRLAWDLFEGGRLGRFFYFSTAYVPGSRSTLHALEDELTPTPAHANFYESSKYEAEGMVRRAADEGLPVTIFRPSIVVGDSRTGAVSEFNVIYPLMKLFAHGILTALPARSDSVINVVPIDFVVRAVGAIARREDSVGKAFHLVTERPPTIGTLLRVKDREFPTMPPVALVDPVRPAGPLLRVSTTDGLKMIDPYLSYLDCPLTFDTTNAREALEGTGVSFPRTDYQFLASILRYAVDRGYLIA